MSESQQAATTIARRYHDAWAEGRIPDAEALLAPELSVEVPINAYPTKESFTRALEAFAGMVDRVHVISMLGDAREAVLLYDMNVSGMGTLRVAEHFTVENGRIVKLVQVHDTVGIRAMGLGS